LGTQIELLDIFLPSKYSSSSRAQLFLWLCYHYLQSTDGPDPEAHGRDTSNPFSNQAEPGHPPALVLLTNEEAAHENVETEEDRAITQQMLTLHEQLLSASNSKAHVSVEKKHGRLAKAVPYAGSEEQMIIKGKRKRQSLETKIDSYTHTDVSVDRK
jgi:Ino eighty subunit 1